MGLADLLSRFARRRARALEELGERVASFRELLQANNAALGHIARIQEALAGDGPIGAVEVRRLASGAVVQTSRMVRELNRLTGDRQRALVPILEGLQRAIAAEVEVAPVLRDVAPVVPLAEVDASLAGLVGGKSALLGEARRVLGGHVPPGFATTIEAHRAFLAQGGLGERLAELMSGLQLDDVAACFGRCAQAVALCERAPVPSALEAALRDATARLPPGARVAVRSSALEEGGLELSFAGQYRSLLNLDAAGVPEAFRQVVASKYSPQAVTYRLSRGFDDADLAMCTCVLTMVDAEAAGVLYSACQGEGGPATLIQAVRGLGLAAVDGSAEPDTVLVERPGGRVTGRKRGLQLEQLRAAPDAEGTIRLPVEDGGAAAAPILGDAGARALAALAWRLEDALGSAVDLEWAIDARGELWVLQVRPQPVHADEASAPRGARLAGVPVLLEGGSRASRGAAAGPATRVETDLDLLRFPRGGVLVSREANPRFAVLLPKAAALVCDLGETTGHLATVARELRVPALFATRSATAVLRDGEPVTVDADAGCVYPGRIDALLTASAAARPARPSAARERLARVAALVTPLSLPERVASGFSPRQCRTLHDIVRLCHQAAIAALFSLGDSAEVRGARLRRLRSGVPIDCRLLDLGGGLAPGAPEDEVTIEHVACEPLRALWRGMTDPRVPWRAGRASTLQGFVSSIASFGLDPDAGVRALGEPSYVFISDDYLSLNSRVGYHFATLDARAGAHPESNYLSFRFVGGSTGADQRSRRARLMERVLAAHGFETDRLADLVNARVRRLPAEALAEKLELAGRLLSYVNHLDMALVSDEVAGAYERAFLAGDLGYTGGPDARA